MLSELYHYVDEHPRAEDAKCTSLTLKYLEACNKLFEMGFLSHDKVLNMNSSVLKSIDDGFRFFTNRMNQIFEKGTLIIITLTPLRVYIFDIIDPSFDNKSPVQRKHFAWQSMCYTILIFSV